jgi:hypothetical protein
MTITASSAVSNMRRSASDGGEAQLGAFSGSAVAGMGGGLKR